jgi:hypothetical protein
VHSADVGVVISRALGRWIAMVACEGRRTRPVGRVEAWPSRASVGRGSRSAERGDAPVGVEDDVGVGPAVEDPDDLLSGPAHVPEGRPLVRTFCTPSRRGKPARRSPTRSAAPPPAAGLLISDSSCSEVHHLAVDDRGSRAPLVPARLLHHGHSRPLDARSVAPARCHRAAGQAPGPIWSHDLVPKLSTGVRFSSPAQPH